MNDAHQTITRNNAKARPRNVYLTGLQRMAQYQLCDCGSCSCRDGSRSTILIVDVISGLSRGCKKKAYVLDMSWTSTWGVNDRVSLARFAVML